MENCFELNEYYSTTRLVTKNKPARIKLESDKFESYVFLPEKGNRQGEGGLRTVGFFKKSYPNSPLITVVTITFNSKNLLEKTIKSIVKLDYNNIEYIIIDGGSHDGTLDLIKNYEHAIDYWVSEEDEGISDAFNKGCILASEKTHIIMINAGDIIENKLEKLNVKDLLPFYDLVAFNVFNRLTGYVFPKCKTKNPSRKEVAMLAHQAVFISKDTYKKAGLYDKDFKIRMDFEMLTRISKLDPKVLYENKNLSIFDGSGISSSLKNSYVFQLEGALALKKNKIIIGYSKVFLLFSASIRVLKISIRKAWYKKQ